MSTPTSDRRGRRVRFLAALALLAACAPPPGAMELRSVERTRAVITAGGNSVVVVPPAGYCIVRDSAQTGEQGVFLLIGACPSPAEGTLPALLTASISPAALFTDGTAPADELDRLETFLGSDRGRPLLGRSGAPGAPEILESYRENDALILLVEDKGEPVLAVSAPRFWRAFLELNGRMASLSASTLAGERGDDRAVLALMRDFVAALRTANAASALPPAQAE